MHLPACTPSRRCLPVSTLLAAAVLAGSCVAAIAATPLTAPASPEVPGPSASLYAAPFYTCVRNFYVATTGSDANPGSAASPWFSIQHADSSARRAGDCINVAPGLYNGNVVIQHGGNAPTPTGYVAYRCQTLDGCHVLAGWYSHAWGIRQPANFVAIDGFEIDGNSAISPGGVAIGCVGSDDAGYGTGGASHHLWVLNNVLHDCSLAGVSFNNREWYYVIHNTVYDNSWSSPYQGSGISFVVAQCIEKINANCASGATYKGGTGTYVASGMDYTFALPFHNVVRGNNVYNNKTTAASGLACGQHTDGNGIIMDTFVDQATLKLVYPYATLIEGNVVHGNGGRGIHLFRTSNVTVANNTVYGNGTDTCNNSYYFGDLSMAGGSNNQWIGNIAQSVLTPANPSCGLYCGDRNAPLVAGDAAGFVDTNNLYFHNVTFGGDGVQLFNNDVGYFSCYHNRCNMDPRFEDPAAGSFALKSESPAIHYGQLEPYLPATAVDAGACSSLLSVCPAN